jgi:putative ABC transport system permease protein
MVIIKICFEAIRQALDSMRGSKLRTFLSLLGITIGIFCIIAVKSAVDSLQANIVSGFNELGTDVVYVDKTPWNEDPNQNYWKYAKRPDPDYDDFLTIKEKSKVTDVVSYTVFTGGRIIKYKSSSVSNAFIMGSTYDFPKIQSFEFERGRFLTRQEYESGTNKLVLGANIAKALFNVVEPVGQTVKLFGQDFLVIGVLKAEGENMFNFINFDDVIWVGYNNVKKFVNTGQSSRIGRMLAAKAIEGVEMDEFKGELTGVLRASRRLKPLEDDNFAINELSMLSQVLDSVFGVINIAGFFIGIFALIVGMFSVANIMFVSVKERTNIIGIKKALGAKREIILLEFLIEAIILCIFGGLIGLALVFGVLKGLSSVIPFEMNMSFSNLLIGLIASVVVGIISGVIPALQASKLDPVVAIRA